MEGVPMTRSFYIAAGLATAQAHYERLLRSVAAVGTLVVIVVIMSAG
jgi:hypothetical protein